jgi:hypothetical protein
MKKIKILILSFMLLLIIHKTSAREFTIGVSPSIIDLGDVSPGSSIPVSFFIVTPSDETLLVYLEPREALIDFFDNPKYKDYINNYSEESVTGWVQVFSNPVELKPIGEIQTTGGIIKGWREVSFLLNIPENAEPGYHLLRILPKPALPTDRIGQVGVQIAALVPVSILFRIEGNAIREGRILDITTGRLIGKNLELLVHFLNTGTVTLSARANKIEIFNKTGHTVVTLTSDMRKIKPGEKQTLSALLPLKDVESGEYKIYAKVNFLTGSTEKNSTINIYREVPLAPPSPPRIPKPITIPIWILIAIIFFIIIVVIYRGKDEE